MKKKHIALTMCMVIGVSTAISTRANAEVNNGWVNANNQWNYYSNGNLETGWLKDNDNFYYLKDDGYMTTGWQKVDGTWYFMDDSGVMKTGWLKDNGDWYYLNESGAMVSNETIDGYYLGKNGDWIENASQEDNSLKDVTMKTEKNTYNLGVNEINLYITNNGKNDVYYGLQYEVEKFENNKWVKVPFKDGGMFIEIAYVLKPRETNTQSIPLDNLDQKLTTGKYRVVKTGGAWCAEFEIK